MKKIKNTLLSVLLFSFAFLVLHDYAIAQVDFSHKHELILSESSSLLKSECVTLSMESQIHESVHTMISSEIGTFIVSGLIIGGKPLDIEISLATHDNFVLERPPLA